MTVFIKRKIVSVDILSAYTHTHVYTQATAHTSILTMQNLIYTQNGQQIDLGKIQGDGRKFLDSFKSYFGSQISSQPLNETHICQLQPKSATKGDFFHIIFVFDCFESASRIANGERRRRSAM